MNNLFKIRVEKLMNENNINQLGLAKELNITQSTLSRNINGIHRPKAEIIEGIADFFNVSTDYLLGLSNERNLAVDATPIQDEALIALYNQTEGLSKEQMDQVISYVQFLKSKDNKK